MQQMPLRMRLHDAARFANFVPGANVEVMHLLAQPGPSHPQVLWLWGRRGTGKSHLLQAACAAAGEQGQAAGYVELATAPASAMLDGCESLALVCLDGLDAIAADPTWNTALFRLYTLMQESAARLVVASTAPPASLPFQLPDLRSRLLAASVHQLVELDAEGQCRALQRRAAARGLELAEEAALYLVHRLPRDLPSLFGILDELDHASLVAQRRLTIPFLREALEGRLPDQRA